MQSINQRFHESQGFCRRQDRMRWGDWQEVRPAKCYCHRKVTRSDFRGGLEGWAGASPRERVKQEETI